MKSVLLFLSILTGLSTTSLSAKPISIEKYIHNDPLLVEWIYPNTDDRFGGFYLDIENLTPKREFSIFKLYEIQNLMRDCLEGIGVQEKKNIAVEDLQLAHTKQAPYLKGCLTSAIEQVKQNHFESKLDEKMMANLGPKDLVVVWDLDETVLSHWYKLGDTHPELADFISETRDVTTGKMDFPNNKLDLLYSPKGVSIRPGAEQAMKDITKLPHFKGFVIYTAKHDLSAHILANELAAKFPELKKYFLALFTRNYLRFDGKVSKPSKDLAMIDADLNNVIIIDDNPGRVIPLSLNYSIPKYNADLYLQAKNNLMDFPADQKKNVIEANEKVFDHVVEILKDVVTSAKSIPEAFYPYSTENDYLTGNSPEKDLLRSTAFSDNAKEKLLFKKHNSTKIDDFEKETKLFEPGFYSKSKARSTSL